jgi:hypothetical protein
VTELLRPTGQPNTLVVTTHPLLDNSTEFRRQVSHTKTYTGQVSCWLNQHALPWMGRTIYGWDFVPAVYSTGIWREVSLHTTGSLSFSKSSLLAQSLNVIPRLTPPYATAQLELALEIELSCGGACEVIDLTIHWHVSAPTGARAADLTSQHNVLYNDTDGNKMMQILRANLTLPDPALWWPNGYGDQPIYRAAATISSGVTQLDHISTSFGVRELTVGTNPHLASGWAYTQYGPEHTSTVPWGWGSWEARVIPPIPPNATAWQISINGRPIFMRGGNWIPRDQLFGRGVRERNRTTQILEAARHAGFTWMRVWGGGLIEDQHFYEECDRLGLMLLQEFPHGKLTIAAGMTFTVVANADCTAIIFNCISFRMRMRGQPGALRGARVTHSQTTRRGCLWTMRRLGRRSSSSSVTRVLYDTTTRTNFISTPRSRHSLPNFWRRYDQSTRVVRFTRPTLRALPSDTAHIHLGRTTTLPMLQFAATGRFCGPEWHLAWGAAQGREKMVVIPSSGALVLPRNHIACIF